MKSRLKVCPFCGSRARKKTWYEGGFYSVNCRECGCIGPAEQERDKAIAAWNRRAGEKKK